MKDTDEPENVGPRRTGKTAPEQDAAKADEPSIIELGLRVLHGEITEEQAIEVVRRRRSGPPSGPNSDESFSEPTERQAVE